MSLSETKLTDNRLRKLLHTKFGHRDEARNPKTVHVSMLTDHRATHEYCPRESALSYLHALPSQDRWIATSERLTYDIGSFVHDHLVRKMTAHLVGDWYCPNCENEWRGEFSRCRNCKYIPIYREMFFRSPTYGVIGSVDMCLDLGFKNKKAIIVEMKSIEKDAFLKLVMPTAEHRQRVLGYLHLLKDAAKEDKWIKKNIELKFGYVLYISKGYGHYFKNKGSGGVNEKYSPFQEFICRPKDGAQQHVEEMFLRAGEYWDWKNEDQSGALPNRIKNCSGLKSKRALKCIACKECWDGE